ncbi:MAG: hypothetical protein IRZ03_13270 [Acidobacterium ailaaui]|nr:hypothetical protein [Pseudacidobacterium ailaaui]
MRLARAAGKALPALGWGLRSAQKSTKMAIFRAKPAKTPKKPVEIPLLPLTKPLKSRKVNGGRFF